MYNKVPITTELRSPLLCAITDENTGSDDESKRLSFRREATNVGHPSGRHIEVVCIARVFPPPPLHIQC